jgi:hypothetical protein
MTDQSGRGGAPKASDLLGIAPDYPSGGLAPGEAMPTSPTGLWEMDSCAGSVPTQAEGRFADGRPFYFRARHGTWTLDVGDPSWPDDYSDWPTPRGYGTWGDLEVASGDDPTGGFMPAVTVARHLEEWIAPLWVGVDRPGLWAAAGFSPADARRLESLPAGHPDRPSGDALTAMAGLRRAARGRP